MSTSAAPSRIGPYAILAPLGSGGMGMVYRARNIETAQEVALKTVLTSRTTQLSSLRREIHALMQIRHPGVVRLVAQGVHDGRPWYAMELIDGATLSSQMRSLLPSTGAQAIAIEGDDTTSPAITAARSGEQSPISSGGVFEHRRFGAHATPANWPRMLELLGIIQGLCAPLAFIHAKGIVHRDLKPANVLIRADGVPVLTDFGLASHFAGLAGRESVDLVGDLRGTPAYMAPELLRGRSAVDARADLYSLGCILYEIATGQRPFSTSSIDECIRGHLYRHPVPPSELTTIPAPLEDLILRLLAKDPRHRIGHADDIALMLAEVRGVSGDEAATRAERGYLYRPQLAGRERVSTELEDLVAAAAQGEGRAVMIGGESGIGKTSLATALTGVAHEQGFLVVIGACEPNVMADGSVGGAAPLHPFRPLLQGIADFCLEHGEASTERILGNGALVLAAYEPRLAELPGVDRLPPPAELPPEGALERLFTILAEAIANLTVDRPLLLVLDDLHWADDLSLKFLRQLPGNFFSGRRLMILGTYRSDEVGASLKSLLDVPGIVMIRAGRLSETAIGAMVADMLALPDPPAALLELLVRLSSGNPFFVAEYLRAAVAEGLLYRESGRWQAMAEPRGGDADGRAPALPSSVRELVSRRIDGLDSPGRRMVEAAATLGREFDSESLHAMLDTDEDETFRAISELIERQVFEEVDDSRLAFAHHQIRDVAYERIEPERRRSLHLAAATTIERAHAGDADFALRFIGLARHWEGAGEIPKAVEYLDKAGDYALHTSAYMDTVRLFGKAADLSSKNLSPDVLHDAHRQSAIGEAWIGLDDYANSRIHLSRAVSILGYPLPEPRGRPLGLLAELARQVSHRMRPSRDRPPVSQSLDEAARAYAHMQTVWRYTENPGLVLVYTALRGLNLAERGASPETAAMAYAQAVVYAATVPLHRAARRYEQMAQEALAATTDRNAHSYARIAIAVYHAGVGNWEHAARASGESAAIALEVGFRRRREDAMAIGGFIEMNWWRPKEAVRIYRDLDESARRGAQRPRIWALGGLAVLALRQGDLREAENRKRQLDALHPDELDPADGLQLSAASGLVGTHIEDPGARRSLDRALTTLEKTPPVLIEVIDPCARLAEAYVRLWRRAAADGTAASELAASVDRVCGYARKLSRRFPVMMPDAHYWQAEAHALRGHERQAINELESSVRAAAQVGMVYHEWRGHQTLADRHPSSDKARQHRARAAELQPAVLGPADPSAGAPREPEHPDLRRA